VTSFDIKRRLFGRVKTPVYKNYGLGQSEVFAQRRARLASWDNSVNIRRLNFKLILKVAACAVPGKRSGGGVH